MSKTVRSGQIEVNMSKKELDHLFQAFDEACTEDSKVMRDCLEESGIDPDRLVREGSSMIEQLENEKVAAAVAVAG